MLRARGPRVAFEGSANYAQVAFTWHACAMHRPHKRYCVRHALCIKEVSGLRAHARKRSQGALGSRSA
eukprot:2008541-Alexandrium_andersonii.AAC.1